MLAFADAVALAGDQGDVGVVGEAVDEGDQRRGVGEDRGPVLEGEVGRDEGGAGGFVAGIQDAVEQVGGLVVEGEVADLVEAEQRKRPMKSGLDGRAIVMW